MHEIVSDLVGTVNRYFCNTPHQQPDLAAASAINSDVLIISLCPVGLKISAWSSVGRLWELTVGCMVP